VNGKLLPPASAAKKALSLLERGGNVTVESRDRKVVIMATSVAEFLDKVWEFLME
jgi:hypothetical protein